jgi:hypothetical protein
MVALAAHGLGERITALAAAEGLLLALTVPAQTVAMGQGAATVKAEAGAEALTAARTAVTALRTLEALGAGTASTQELVCPAQYMGSTAAGALAAAARAALGAKRQAGAVSVSRFGHRPLRPS